MNSDQEKDVELQTTKEVFNLEDFNEIPTKEDTELYNKEIFENMDESDLQFQEEVEKLEVPDNTIIVEPKKKEKKKFKDKIKKIKENWHNLPKKKKAIIIIVTVIIFLLIILGIVFLVTRKKPEVVDVPDVILEEDNYTSSGWEVNRVAVKMGVVPIIHLKPEVIITGGSGTDTSPYEIEM